MRLSDYGLRLVIVDKEILHVGQKITMFNLVRAIGLTKAKVGILLYHNKHLCEFWYRWNKKELVVSRSRFYFGHHTYTVSGDGTIFDVYMCAKNHGITSIDVKF